MSQVIDSSSSHPLQKDVGKKIQDEIEDDDNNNNNTTNDSEKNNTDISLDVNIDNENDNCLDNVHNGSDNNNNNSIVNNINKDNNNNKKDTITIINNEVEEGEEEEDDDNIVKECRICTGTEGKFIAPCKCNGTTKYVHLDCLSKWIRTRPGVRHPTENLVIPNLKCEICHDEYNVQLTRKFTCSCKIIRTWHTCFHISEAVILLMSLVAMLSLIVSVGTDVNDAEESEKVLLMILFSMTGLMTLLAIFKIYKRWKFDVEEITIESIEPNQQRRPIEEVLIGENLLGGHRPTFP